MSKQLLPDQEKKLLNYIQKNAAHFASILVNDALYYAAGLGRDLSQYPSLITLATKLGDAIHAVATSAESGMTNMGSGKFTRSS